MGTFILKFHFTLLYIIAAYLVSTTAASSQVSKNQFKGAVDEDSPIFKIQKGNAENIFSGKVGDLLIDQTAVFENLEPDSNLAKYTPVSFKVTVAALNTNELILETKTFSTNAPENILPWRHKIPLPLTEETNIELELLPTLKNMWKKSKFVVKILPLAQIKINSVENGEVEVELINQFETWAFSPDLFQRLIILDNKGHNIYTMPPYTVELVE